MRQNSGLIVALTVLRGSIASPAIVAMCSPPPNEKPAWMNALQIPRIPLLNAPGFFQYLNSMGPFVAAIPPEVIMIMKKIIATMVIHFSADW